MAAISVKHTKVYKLAFDLAMEIFEITKKFPKEETYSLTDQIRRSSRSVCINLLEAYRKKQYPAHFVAKVSDSDMENSETSGWLDFALACKYINSDQHSNFILKNDEIGRLLNHMMNNPEKY
ncbi:MAG: four helix bundle protein [Chitinophagaceae bacterium]|nr:four helix bundle protein [Chitinophagaceae bacterium]MBP9102488.1 four helix bundle protein [Chitinophagaceae bacterium]